MTFYILVSRLSFIFVYFFSLRNSDKLTLLDEIGYDSRIAFWLGLWPAETELKIWIFWNFLERHKSL